MIKYRDKRITLSIDLPKKCGYEGYYIDCCYSFDRIEKQYLVTMELRRKDIEECIQPINCQYIKGDRKNIEHILRHVVEASSLSGFFDEYIKKFDYKCKCFDKGNDFFENLKLPCSVKEYEIVRTAYSCTRCGEYVDENIENCPYCNAKLNWELIEDETE